MATDWVDLKQKLTEYAKSIGIAKIGFTSAEPMVDHLPRLHARAEGRSINSIYEGRAEIRINPLAHLPGAKSVISIAVTYPWWEQEPSNSNKRGRISLISRGMDYHKIIKNLLDRLKNFIIERVPQARMITMVDNVELLEKALAEKAGLGWVGKNTLLITPEFGSWVCLGELITDLPFPLDKPLPNNCADCQRCIEACPAKALDKDKNLNIERCIAGITQVKSLPEHGLRTLMGNTIYGCDICQTVCPYNARHLIPDYREAGCDEDCYPKLVDLLKMDNTTFRERFGHTSGAWRGRMPFQRNAVIAAGNLKDYSVVPELIDILKQDARPVMRAASAWALGELGTTDALDSLRQADLHEKSTLVKSEIEGALEKNL